MVYLKDVRLICYKRICIYILVRSSPLMNCQPSKVGVSSNTFIIRIQKVLSCSLSAGEIVNSV